MTRGALAITMLFGLIVSVGACDGASQNQLLAHGDADDSLTSVPSRPATGSVGLALKVIGPAGGTVRTDSDSLTMEFPPNALAADVEITVEPTAAFPSYSRLVPGTGVEFGPDGLTFAHPVTVRIAYDPSTIPPDVDESSLRIHKAIDGEWREVAGGTIDIERHLLEAPLSGFSKYAAVGRRAKAVETKVPDPTREPDPAEQADPNKAPGPAENPDLIKTPDPEKTPDPAEDLDPPKDPDPAEDLDPPKDPDPADDPNPAEDPDPAKDPEPAEDPDPAEVECGPGVGVCPSGLVCLQSGNCIRPVPGIGEACARDSDCDRGLGCDPDQNKCVQRQPGNGIVCASESSCPAGFGCNLIVSRCALRNAQAATIEEEVGPGGTALQTGDGNVVLFFEAEAVATPVLITARPATNVPASPWLVPGTAYTFGPDEITFGAPVRVILSYDTKDLPNWSPATLKVYKLESDGWQPVANSVNDYYNPFVGATLSGLGTYALLSPPDCRDQLACTDDVLVDDRCEHRLQDGFCLIDGICREPGPRPGNPCERCAPEQSTSDWSNSIEGTTCGNFCSGGTCGPGSCSDGVCSQP